MKAAKKHCFSTSNPRTIWDIARFSNTNRKNNVDFPLFQVPFHKQHMSINVLNFCISKKLRSAAYHVFSINKDIHIVLAYNIRSTTVSLQMYRQWPLTEKEIGIFHASVANIITR